MVLRPHHHDLIDIFQDVVTRYIEPNAQGAVAKRA
jgi:hypothetical protein